MLNLVLSLSISHTGHWKFIMAPHGKELSEDLKKIIVALHKEDCQDTETELQYSGQVILRGQQMYTVIQTVHSLLYIVAKCHFFSVVT